MMFRTVWIILLVFFVSCKTTTYYIVRHAEKEQGSTMLSDPPLSAEGEKRAVDLKNFLLKKNIKTIYSTNYARTIATAEPLRKELELFVKIYDPKKTEQLIDSLKKIGDGNVLVVGHSNTVDDVVNGLMGETKMSDLADTEYGDVFIVTKKRSHYSFERAKVPQAAR